MMHYCDKLSSTINFLPDIVKYCCECSIGLWIDLTEQNIFSQDEFLSKRRYYINELMNNNIPENCLGCVNLKKKEIDEFSDLSDLNSKQEKNFINHIIVNHFRQCDCRCIYCAQEATYQFHKEKYSLLPIIKDLYDKELIDREHLKVEFQGGNVSVLNEFNDLMMLFYENGCKEYTILTNGIKYLDVLETIAHSYNRIFIVTSLDAGTKETFKYIKQVDAFDKILANINSYSKRDNIKIVLKYIIIKSVNDNKIELKSFLDLAKNIRNLHAIVIDIDYRNTFMSDSTDPFIIPEHYFELFEITKKFSRENNIQLDIPTYVEKILSDGKSYSIVKKSI